MKLLILNATILICGYILSTDNTPTIPTPPSLINYYKAEISKLDLVIEKLAPPMVKWNAFQRAYPYINPKIYEEKNANNKQLIEVFGVLGHLTPLPSEHGETRYKLSPRTNNGSMDPLVVEHAENKLEQIKEIDCRIHYEMKREFLKRIQSGEL